MRRFLALLLIVLPTAVAAQTGTAGRDRETTQARSAGPVEVGRGATIYVLGAKGYERGD